MNHALLRGATLLLRRRPRSALQAEMIDWMAGKG